MSFKHMNACPVKGEKALKIIQDLEYKTQEKFKGIRAFMFVTPQGSYLCTRGGFYVEQNFPHLAKISCDHAYVLDGELWQDGVEDEVVAGWANSKYIIDDTSGVIFQCFDIVQFRGTDLTESGDYAIQTERDFFRRRSIDTINHPAIQFVPYLDGDPEQVFAEIVSRGGEGIIRRNMSATYTQRDGDNRPTRHWYKVKSTETYDVVVTGFKPGKGKYEGLIGAIQYGQVSQAKHEGDTRCIVPLGYCSGMSDEMRSRISEDSGAYLSKVMEVKAAGRDANSHALIEPRFIRWRDDKPWHQCII